MSVTVVLKSTLMLISFEVPSGTFTFNDENDMGVPPATSAISVEPSYKATRSKLSEPATLKLKLVIIVAKLSASLRPVLVMLCDASI